MAIYLCPTPNYRRSLQPSKENIQNFRIRIRIANPDPDKDPVTTLNPDPIRINITASELIKSPLFHHIKGRIRIRIQ
jgi:hypothetical protein